MPAPSNNQQIPEPAVGWRSVDQQEPGGGKELSILAKLFQPMGTRLEQLVATFARYAHRVIDRTTGIPYSADELLALTIPNYGLTALTGGASNALDGVATVDLPIGTARFVIAGGVLYFYQLNSGTNAEDSPTVIRPDDYATTANQKVWLLRSIRLGTVFVEDRVQINSGYVALTGGSGGSVDIYGQDDGEDGTLTAPSVDGTMVVAPPYADDTAAGAGGVSSGDFFWDTTNKKLAQKS